MTAPAQAIAFLAIAVFALSGCGQRFEMSDVPVAVPTKTAGTEIGEKTIELRTYFHRGSAVSELNNASCVVSAGRGDVEVVPPIRLIIAISSAPLPTIDVTCAVAVGSRSMTTSMELRPLISSPTKENNASEVYLDIVNIRFF